MFSASSKAGAGVELSGQTINCGGWSGRERDLGQVSELLEDLFLVLAIEFLLARHVGLDSRDPQWLDRGLHLQGPNPEGGEAHDCGHGQGEIEMRPSDPHFSLKDKSPDGSEGDDVGEGDKKRKPRDAGELRDLDERQYFVQGDSETIPAPAAEHPAAHPFQRGPGCGENQREPKIMERAEPGRTRFRRNSLGCGFSREPGPALCAGRKPRGRKTPASQLQIAK